jgi:gamma-glutamyltranspeptidase/glutathione hydrolase
MGLALPEIREAALHRSFRTAIRYASDGFIVSPITAAKWSSAPEHYREYPDFGAAFLPGGRAPAAGELFRPHGFAPTLKSLAETDGESLYRGELAGRILSHSRRTGGTLTEEDLASHRSEWVEPLCIPWSGVTLHELPPNGQGLTVLVALGLLRGFPIKDFSLDSADSLHLQIEAMKLAFGLTIHALRSGWMTSPLIASRSVLSCRTGAEDPDGSGRLAESADNSPSEGGRSILDRSDQTGMMVFLHSSQVHGFGRESSCRTRGSACENRGAGFTLQDGHPNRVAGGKRPYHTIIPGFVMKDGVPLMSFGVMGAHMQAQGHVQMMVRIVACGQNPQAAADAPRWYLHEDAGSPWSPCIVDGGSRGTCSARHRMPRDVQTAVFGGAQLIYRLSGRLTVPRRPEKGRTPSVLAQAVPSRAAKYSWGPVGPPPPAKVPA